MPAPLQFGAKHGDYVVGGDDADEFVVFIHHGEGDEIVFVKELGDLVFIGRGVAEDQRFLGERHQKRGGVGEHKFGERNRADESAVGIDEVNGADGFDAAFELTHDADGILDRGGKGNGEELSGHAASGGFLAMLEKFDDFLAGLGLHLDEDLFGTILRKIGEQVGGGVGIHFLDNVGGAFGVERFDDCALNPGLNLFERLGCNIFVKGAEDRFALIGGKVFDDVRDVGGMKRGQAFVRNLEFDAARGIGFDEVDKTPGNGARRNFFEQDMEGGARRKAPQQAANRAANADIDGLDAEGGMQVSAFGRRVDLQVDVVHANDFASVNVDDLLIEKIAFEQEEAFSAVGERPLGGIGGGVNVRVNGGDGGEGKDAVSGFRLDDERGDAVAVFLRGESDLAHASTSGARRVIDGGAEKLGKRQRGHPA